MTFCHWCTTENFPSYSLSQFSHHVEANGIWAGHRVFIPSCLQMLPGCISEWNVADTSTLTVNLELQYASFRMKCCLHMQLKTGRGRNRDEEWWEKSDLLTSWPIWPIDLLTSWPIWPIDPADLLTQMTYWPVFMPVPEEEDCPAAELRQSLSNVLFEAVFNGLLQQDTRGHLCQWVDSVLCSIVWLSFLCGIWVT